MNNFHIIHRDHLRDSICSEFCNIHSSASISERLSIRGRIRIRDNASLVPVQLEVAVCRVNNGACHCCILNHTALSLSLAAYLAFLKEELLTGSVCKVIRLFLTSLIPSKVSISPPDGQLGATLQLEYLLSTEKLTEEIQ